MTKTQQAPSRGHPSDRRRLRGERSRANVLAHSMLIASTEGLEGLTIGRVATEAGVGKGNIQVLFGDKEALQLATLEHAMAMYVTDVVTPAMAKPTPLARLFALVDGWFEFVAERSLPGGCMLNAASSEYRAKTGAIRDRIEVLRSEARERFRTLIRDAKVSGEFRADVDEDLLAFELTAYQAAANVAGIMGDQSQFDLARRLSHEQLERARES